MDEDSGSLPHPPQSSPELSGRALESLSKKQKRSEREIRRLRDSVSFKLGLHLTEAVRRPWRLAVLPVTFPLLCFKLGMQRLGRRPLESAHIPNTSEHGESKNCIVLFPTNGVGFGHFTRMYAVARALRKADSSLEIVFFTSMPTLHPLYNEGFISYHLSGRYMFNDISSTEWNGLVEDMLHMVFDIHRPSWFIFDGAYPYRGMLNAISSQQNMSKWWMRRGSMKVKKTVPIDSFSFFDGVFVPGEKTTETYENCHVIPPVKVLNSDEIWERAYARSKLSIPGNSRVVYVQLGAGRINNIENVLHHVLDVLFGLPDTYVVLGESMLGERLEVQHEFLRVIRDYPNSLYAKGFDASIQAGGYNSYHEMRTFGIPTLFIPNTETGMDDQLARCRGAVEEGWGLIYSLEDNNLKAKIEQLFNIKTSGIEEKNGADFVPEILGIE